MTKAQIIEQIIEKKQEELGCLRLKIIEEKFWGLLPLSHTKNLKNIIKMKTKKMMKKLILTKTFF